MGAVAENIDTGSGWFEKKRSHHGILSKSTKICTLTVGHDMTDAIEQKPQHFVRCPHRLVFA